MKSRCPVYGPAFAADLSCRDDAQADREGGVGEARPPQDISRPAMTAGERMSWRHWSLVLILGVIACSAPPDAQSFEPPKKVRLLHWWTSDEDLAIETLASHFRDQSGIEVKLSSKSSARNARALLGRYWSGTDPREWSWESSAELWTPWGEEPDQASNPIPEVVLANCGQDLLRWAPRTPEEFSPLLPLKDTAILWEDFSAEAMSGIQANGNNYAVPLNIHRINGIFYNELLQNPELIETWEDLLQSNTMLRGQGRGGILAGQGWEIAHAVFENLLFVYAGGDFYERLFHGRADYADGRLIGADRALLRSVLERAQTDLSTFDKSPDWRDAVKAVASVNPTHAFTIAADWSLGLVRTAEGRCQQEGDCNEEWGEGLGFMPLPGAQDEFVFTMDCLAVSRGSTSQKWGQRFLEFAAKPESQLLFSLAKGSIPAVEANLGFAGETYRAWLKAGTQGSTMTRHRALSAVVTEGFLGPVQEALRCTFGRDLEECRRFSQDPVGVDDTMRVIDKLYPLLME